MYAEHTGPRCDIAPEGDICQTAQYKPSRQARVEKSLLFPVQSAFTDRALISSSVDTPTKDSDSHVTAIIIGVVAGVVVIVILVSSAVYLYR